VAKAQTFSKAPRPGLPGNWQEFGADMLARLNKERKSELAPPTDTVAASVADLILMAEMMLQAIPAEGQEWMDHLVWKKLDLPGALENVPSHLPAQAGQQSGWSAHSKEDGSEMAITLDLPYMIQTAADVTFTHGTLYNRGGGLVRIVLESYRVNGEPWRCPPEAAPPAAEAAAPPLLQP
jgi:hypothetical protein